MCGRYNLLDSPSIQELLEGLGVTYQKGALGNQYNLSPTEDVPVVVSDGKRVGLEPMRWWLTPVWAKEPTTKYSMFNARAETLDKSAAFKPSLHHQRCIFPLSSFIEWQKQGAIKQPYEIAYEADAMAVAGLWSHWVSPQGADLFSCTMITADAVSDFEAFHHRQPAFLTRDEAKAWIDPSVEGKDLMHLLQRQLPHPLMIRAIDPAINNSRNKAAPQYLDVDPVYIEAQLPVG